MPMHETETILMSSGFLPASLAAVRQRWQVIDIPCQREAAAHLRGMVSPPLVVCIGRVDSRGRGADLDVWEMLREVKAAAPGVPVLISTGVNSPKHIVELVKAGAFDYVLEPQCRTDQQEIDRYTEDLLLALRRAVEWRRLSMENLSLKQGLLSEDLPVPLRGVSRAMGQVMELATAAADYDFDYNGYGSIGTGRFFGVLHKAEFNSLAELREKTTEKHAIAVDLGIFKDAVPFPDPPFPARPYPRSLELKTGAAAVDQGQALPNVNDGYVGRAPDLGAYELGSTPPHYGPRTGDPVKVSR